jgi:hypothetical protein
MRILVILGLLVLASCSTVQRLVPHYAVKADADAGASVYVGRDVIAAQTAGAASLALVVQEVEGGPWVVRLAKDLAAGEGWYQSVTWGPSDGGWIELSAVSCERARMTYPALDCPEPNPASFRGPIDSTPQRFPMFVGRE